MSDQQNLLFNNILVTPLEELSSFSLPFSIDNIGTETQKNEQGAFRDLLLNSVEDEIELWQEQHKKSQSNLEEIKKKIKK